MRNQFLLYQLLLTGFLPTAAQTQDIRSLLQQVKAKYDRVSDYTADGRLKTNVLFIKAPVARVKVYFRKPDQLKIRNEKGVSFIPKGSVNINMNNVLGLQSYEALESGTETVNGTLCRVVRIFPLSESDAITRATLYIDEKQLLVLKSVISTRENGTYELLLQYRTWASWGLPDRVNLTFNTREYKLPKGISIDYDNGAGNAPEPKDKKGRVEIEYSGYRINQGVPDAVFTGS